MIEKKITPATAITLLRIVLVPFFPYFFVRESYLTAIVILALAGFTDFLDGWIARRFNMRSRLGSFLDPTADKLLMLVSFITLSRIDFIPWWLTWLVIGRDLGIVFGVITLNLMKIRLYYKPTRTSKMATFSQIGVLGFSLLLFFLQKEPDKLLMISRPLIVQINGLFVWIAAMCTLITYFQYGYLGWKFYRYGERSAAEKGQE